jgi:hypothetical protein
VAPVGNYFAKWPLLSHLEPCTDVPYTSRSASYIGEWNGAADPAASKRRWHLHLAKTLEFGEKGIRRCET